MTERSTFLRLVPSDEGMLGPTRVERKQGQLSFPFPEVSSIYFIVVDDISQEAFCRLLGVYAPRWIFDVRSVPRLDIVASSRRAAFAYFNRINLSYIDLFGRIGVKSYRSVEANPSLWQDELMKIIYAGASHGPYFFLFDYEPLMEAAQIVLPEAMAAVEGKEPPVSVIRSLDAAV